MPDKEGDSSPGIDCILGSTFEELPGRQPSEMFELENPPPSIGYPITRGRIVLLESSQVNVTG
jgi:hypothetical protein